MEPPDSSKPEKEKRASHGSQWPLRPDEINEQAGLEVYHPPEGKDRASQAPEVYFSDKASTKFSYRSNRNTSFFTFYREPTPTPPEYEEEDRRLGHRPVEPRAQDEAEAQPLPYFDPPPSLGGKSEKKRKRWFWLFCCVLFFVLLAIALGVGLGVGLSHVKFGGASNAAESSSAPPASGAASSMSTTTSTSSAASATMTSPTECPANGTTYQVPGSSKSFLRICGIDYSGVEEAVDLTHRATKNFEECMNSCAGTTGCTGCGWGFIEGDTSDHQCWIKGNLQKSHRANSDWHFAMLL